MVDAGNVSRSTDRQILLDTILRHSFQRGRFQLSSGAWSDYYLDLRRTTLDPRGLTAAAVLLLPELEGARIDAVGGPTLGADPLVAAILLEAHRHGHRLPGFLVRPAAKGHGASRQIEGHCPSGARVALLDDVVTRGGSILRAAQAVRAAGAEPVLAIALVDREEGGREAIENDGMTLEVVFGIPEILEEADRRGL